MENGLRNLKEVTSGLKDFYKNYYLRNTKKFIWKYKFKEDDLGREFSIDEGTFTLEGQVAEKTFFIKLKDTNEYYHIDGTFIHRIIYPPEKVKVVR